MEAIERLRRRPESIRPKFASIVGRSQTFRSACHSFGQKSDGLQGSTVYPRIFVQSIRLHAAFVSHAEIRVDYGDASHRPMRCEMYIHGVLLVRSRLFAFISLSAAPTRFAQPATEGSYRGTEGQQQGTLARKLQMCSASRDC